MWKPYAIIIPFGDCLYMFMPPIVGFAPHDFPLETHRPKDVQVIVGTAEGPVLMVDRLDIPPSKMGGLLREFR